MVVISLLWIGLLWIGLAKLADALLYGLDELEPAPKTLAVAGTDLAERADRLVTVGPQFEGEMHVICHVSQLHAGLPAVASGDPA
jgi:hypothetical protein